MNFKNKIDSQEIEDIFEGTINIIFLFLFQLNIEQIVLWGEIIKCEGMMDDIEGMTERLNFERKKSRWIFERDWSNQKKAVQSRQICLIRHQFTNYSLIS